MSLLVPDTSAIVAFAGGSVNVGKPITEVASEGGHVAIPLGRGYMLTAEPNAYGEPGADFVIPV